MRFAPAALAAASILLLTATFVAGPIGEWIYVLVPPLFPVLLIVLALETRRSVPRLAWATVLALGMLLLSSAVAIRLLDAAQETRWWMGLPVSAVVMGLGLVLLPLLLVGFGFAAGFESPTRAVGSGSDERNREP